jgi:FdhD protein
VRALTAPRKLPVWSPRAARAVKRPVQRWSRAGASPEEPDLVVAEEPLEVRIGLERLMVTMRTPGDDLDLTVGLLFTEGVITSIDEIAGVEHLASAREDRENVVSVTPAPGRRLRASGARRVMRATSACGLCGKESIAAVRRRIPSLDDATRVPLSVVLGLPEAIRAAQEVFAATGGLHAVGLFRADGTALVVREDVGRHNAVDKVIGHVLRGGLRGGDLRGGEPKGRGLKPAGLGRPLAGGAFAGTVMMVSGRAGFEIVQKAAVARVPVVCSVSAPSALAIDLAREVGMTLVGFVRGASANVYTHGHRII